jgi:integrase
MSVARDRSGPYRHFRDSLRRMRKARGTVSVDLYFQRHVSPHLFCHSIARHLKSAEFIQKFLGHASIKTTMDTYDTLSLGEMQSIIAQKTGDYSLIGDEENVRGELPPN